MHIAVTDVRGEPHNIEKRVNFCCWQQEGFQQWYVVCLRSVSQRQDPTAFSPDVNVPTPAAKLVAAFASPPFADARADKPRVVTERERSYLMVMTINLSCEIQHIPDNCSARFCQAPGIISGLLCRNHQHILLFTVHAKLTQVFSVLHK